jgi:hypothetical protein
MRSFRSIALFFKRSRRVQREGPEVLGMAPGGKNAVEPKLGSKPSHIGVTFATLLTRLKALSASMSRLIANRNRNEPTVLVRSLPDGLALVCQPRLGEYTGYQSEDLTGRAPLSLAKT